MIHTYISGQIFEVQNKNSLLTSAIMEETGGIGVDVIISDKGIMFININVCMPTVPFSIQKIYCQIAYYKDSCNSLICLRFLLGTLDKYICKRHVFFLYVLLISCTKNIFP